VATSDEVEAYYDHNTRHFLRRRRPAHIHQALWVDGRRTLAEALLTSADWIGARIDAVEAGSVVDLGCGVGGTLHHLAASRPDVVFHGVTVSGEQVRWARDVLPGRVTVHHADFLDLPDVLPVVDLAYSIEAFVHASDPATYLASVSARLAPGGRLLLVDDVLADPSLHDHPEVRRFRAGWRLGSLITTDELATFAAVHDLQLVDDVDHTRHLPGMRPRDWLVRIGLPITRRLWPTSLYWTSMDGGDARQSCLSTGLVTYRFLELVKA
jgi:cyclopropane fatty-acyl-phospholipid synthase-like methyltransferase